MAKCAHCGVTNPEDRQTCYGCGAWLTVFEASALLLAPTAIIVEAVPPLTQNEEADEASDDLNASR